MAVTVEGLESSGPGGLRTRADVLQRGVVAGGSLVLGGVVISGLPEIATSAPSRKQDVDVLNYALLLESLQASFYHEALRRGRLHGEWRQFARLVGREEQRHLDYLRRQLGSRARSIPRFSFGRSVAEPRRFAAAAVALEDLGLAAYNGQAANLTPRALRSALRVISVEARHAAWARDLAGEDPAPHAVDTPASQPAVERQLRSRGLIG